MTLNPNLDAGWIGRGGEAICKRELAQRRAIRKLRKVADSLISNAADPNLVSRAFGYGKTEQDSRTHAGVICQLLANQIQEEIDNE